MVDLSKVKVCYICHPYTANKDTGRGHDRYAYELIAGVKNKNINAEVWEANLKGTYGSGDNRAVVEGAMKEIIFPFKFLTAKADLFHATSPVGAKTAILLRKRPLIANIHDVIHLFIKSGYDTALKYRYKAWCIKLAVEKSDIVITPFQSNKDVLISRFDLSPEKIRVIHIGVNHERFYPIPEAKEQSMTKKIIFVGEATRSKGVDTLIEAFGIVTQKMKDVELLIGSEGRDLDFLKKLALEVGVSDKTRFLGYIPEEELPKYYCMGDVAVFPSRYGFGLPTLEAMACGTPTISGATLDAPEFVGDAGILVKPGDVNQLAREIINILTDESLRKELSKKGIGKAKTFTWEKMVKETIDIYNNVLSWRR